MGGARGGVEELQHQGHASAQQAQQALAAQLLSRGRTGDQARRMDRQLSSLRSRRKLRHCPGGPHAERGRLDALSLSPCRKPSAAQVSSRWTWNHGAGSPSCAGHCLQLPQQHSSPLQCAVMMAGTWGGGGGMGCLVAVYLARTMKAASNASSTCAAPAAAQGPACRS